MIGWMNIVGRYKMLDYDPKKRSRADALQLLLSALAENKTQKQNERNKVDLAMLNLLANRINAQHARLNKYDELLDGSTITGIDDLNSTEEAYKWMGEIRDGENLDMQDLIGKFDSTLNILREGANKKQNIIKQYNKGLEVRDKTREVFKAYDEQGTFEDYRLTGEILEGGVGTPGSEMESLLALDLNTINKEMNAIENIVLGQPNPEEAFKKSSWATKKEFSSLADLQAYYNEQKVLASNLDVFDSANLQNEYFRQGFNKGQMSEQQAMASQQVYMKNQQAALEGAARNYKTQLSIYESAGNDIGLPVLNSIGITAGRQFYTINDLSELFLRAASPNAEDEDIKLYDSVIGGMREGASIAAQYIEGIIFEQASQDPADPASIKGGMFDNVVQMAHDLEERYIQFYNLESRIKEKSQGASVDDWVNMNPEHPNSIEYHKLKGFIDSFHKLGITRESIGQQNMKMAYDNLKFRKAATEKYIEQISSLSGIDDAYIQEEITKHVPSEMPDFSDYLFDNQKLGSEKPIDPLVGEYISEQDFPAEYEEAATSLRHNLSQTQIDEKADIISQVAGIGNWEAYASFEEFQSAAMNAVANKYSDPGMRDAALSKLNTLFESLKYSDLESLSSEAMIGQVESVQSLASPTQQMTWGALPGDIRGGPEGPIYDPHSPSPTHTLDMFYEDLDRVKASLDQLSLIGTFGNETGPAIVAKSRTK